MWSLSSFFRPRQSLGSNPSGLTVQHNLPEEGETCNEIEASSPCEVTPAVSEPSASAKDLQTPESHPNNPHKDPNAFVSAAACAAEESRPSTGATGLCEAAVPDGTHLDNQVVLNDDSKTFVDDQIVSGAEEVCPPRRFCEDSPVADEMSEYTQAVLDEPSKTSMHDESACVAEEVCPPRGLSEDALHDGTCTGREVVFCGGSKECVDDIACAAKLRDETSLDTSFMPTRTLELCASDQGELSANAESLREEGKAEEPALVKGVVKESPELLDMLLSTDEPKLDDFDPEAFVAQGFHPFLEHLASSMCEPLEDEDGSDPTETFTKEILSTERQEESLADSSFSPLLRPPKLRIAILVVGTRGDVQPFVKVGQRLLEDGHRVRLATHPDYGDYVKSNGLEFYSLGGDPKKLSAYMCKTAGRLMPNMASREERSQTREKLDMLTEMMFNTWPAVSKPDPETGCPFRADAIISNPVAYGHVHVAEKLDVPVHLMFPQPWSPTTDFPHPMTLLSGGRSHSSFRPAGVLRRRQNRASYAAINEFMYAGLRFLTNDFRKSMGLEPIRAGERGAHLVDSHHVPISYQWPSLVLPRPTDYGPHVEVTGPIFNDEGAGYIPSVELEAFLKADESPPIFIGFGSMMIDNTEKLASNIVKAAVSTQTRVLLQSSWSTFSSTSITYQPETVSRFVFQLGNCPHDWLFSRVAAVIHHGGAGTTFAGLRAKRPTMICPFFGDQHLWGQALAHLGVAVDPVPIERLTVQDLCRAFETLRGLNEEGAKIVQLSEEVGAKVALDDGVAGAVSSFYRHLPTGLVCDASLMLGPSRDLRLARWHCSVTGLKLSNEFFHLLKSRASADELTRFVEYKFRMSWGFAEPPANFRKALAQAATSATARYVQAGTGLICEPLKSAYGGFVEGGAQGVVRGYFDGMYTGYSLGVHRVRSATQHLMRRPMQAIRGSEQRGPVLGRAAELIDDCGDLAPHWSSEVDRLDRALEAVCRIQCRWPGVAGGQRGPMLMTDVPKLLVELGYPSSVQDIVNRQLRVCADSDVSEVADEEPTVDASECSFNSRPSMFRKSFLRRMQQQQQQPQAKEEDLREIFFEEFVALLWEHGVPISPCETVQGAQPSE